MLSLGQGLFFGLGAYCFGMFLNLEAAAGKMPEFMGLYGVTELPFFWRPFYSPVFAIGAAIIVPMILAAMIGFMLFRSRIQGVYFSIITQALTAIVALLFVAQQQLINGTNGHHPDHDDLWQSAWRTQHDGWPVSGDGGCARRCLSWLPPAGQFAFRALLVAVRDDENRVRFMGYNTVVIKTFVFAISAGIAGLAGVLLVPQVGIISPKQIDIVASIEIVIWVAVGGRGTLIGAIIGALLVNTGKSVISSSNSDIWQLIMGVLFVGVVLLFPKGLVGAVKDGYERLKPLWNKSYVPHTTPEAAIEPEAS